MLTAFFDIKKINTFEAQSKTFMIQVVHLLETETRNHCQIEIVLIIGPYY